MLTVSGLGAPLRILLPPVRQRYTDYSIWRQLAQYARLRSCSALASGMTDKLWSMADVAEMIDATLPTPGPRGPYKKQADQISN
jgi:hypothetical protein